MIPHQSAHAAGLPPVSKYPALQCAEQLEERYKADYKEVIWFLVTDSKTLRQHVCAHTVPVFDFLNLGCWRPPTYDVADLVHDAWLQAHKKYADKIITAVDLHLQHSSRGAKFDPDVAKDEGKDRASHAGFRASAGENWLFGKQPFCLILSSHDCMGTSSAVPWLCHCTCE